MDLQMLMNLLLWKFNYAEIIHKMCVNTCVYINFQDITWQNWMPLQLLPHISRGGDHKHMPIIFGTTRRTVPDTPDLAGSPTLKRYMVNEKIWNTRMLKSYPSLNQKDHGWKIFLHYQNDIELSFFIMKARKFTVHEFVWHYQKYA